MLRPSPILVGIDFSPGAEAALRSGREMGRRLGAPVVAVHVVLNEGATPGPSGWEEWMKRMEVKEESLVFRAGVPWIELSRHGDELGAQMLVVGSHGQSGFQPVVPGATTVMLLTRSRRPVLVVPPRER